MIFYLESYCSDSQPRDFASKETFGNVWRHFLLSLKGGGGAIRVQAQDRHSSVPPHKGLSGPKHQ